MNPDTAYFNIRLNNLTFFAHIGVSEQELKVGNEFEVNVCVRYDADAYQQEQLSSTISYADIYEEIKDEINQRYQLLETVALNIANRIRTRWKVVNELQVNIIKKSPPISNMTGNCSVEYFWRKSS